MKIQCINRLLRLFCCNHVHSRLKLCDTIIIMKFQSTNRKLCFLIVLIVYYFSLRQSFEYVCAFLWIIICLDVHFSKVGNKNESIDYLLLMNNPPKRNNKPFYQSPIHLANIMVELSLFQLKAIVHAFKHTMHRFIHYNRDKFLVYHR